LIVAPLNDAAITTLFRLRFARQREAEAERKRKQEQERINNKSFLRHNSYLSTNIKWFKVD
jgi:hypothetical protein